MGDTPELVVRKNQFPKWETPIVAQLLHKLDKKGVIIPSPREVGEIISPIFLRENSDGSHRLILNLKKANEFISNAHFKMETITSILKLIYPNCYMASIDLKDAYFTVKVKESHQKFLKFQFEQQLYKFTCLPNGLCTGSRKFTKLCKPPLACLRALGHIISSYIDDLINVGDSFLECQQNVCDTITLFLELGFNIHHKKSKLVPTQVLTFLGFIINSKTMKISPTRVNKEKVKTLATELLQRGSFTIRFLARVIGTLISTFPGVKHGPLHFRHLEDLKSKSLQYYKGNFEKFTTLTKGAKLEIEWWLENIDGTDNDIYVPNPDMALYTDASMTGWGGVLGQHNTNGYWLEKEQHLHINVLELRAIKFSLLAFPIPEIIHLKVLSDNTTAVQCLNNKGTSHSASCNSETQQIWDIAIRKELHISATHIPGRLNEEADLQSRKQELRTEWKLAEDAFVYILQHFHRAPEIDLFASRINYQIKPFLSYRPDPEAMTINAFLVSWTNTIFYAFPPFSIISKTLQKAFMDKAEGIIVVPHWKNQPWFSRLTKLLVREPLILSSSHQLLYLPNQLNKKHPLQSLELMACHISGKT